MEPTASQIYKIGTRGSLLAVTQSQITQKQIEEKTGLKLEIQTIKTQGDVITDKPLWQLEGKDFFTKELDANLLLKNIDLVIHSYKDLGSERPEGIDLACITERVFAHDILLIKKSKLNSIPGLSEFTVGTSSPRRIVNLENHLSEYLPHFKGSIKTKMLRGNVNTRIEKLLDDQYDAIVLAFAGLERLAMKPESRKVLGGLVKDLTFMILPRLEFPPAASQGALAIETHSENQSLKEILSPLNHDISIEEIKRERKAFQSYGGGCHLAVGVYVKKIHDYYLHVHRGEVDKKTVFQRHLEGVDYSSLKGKSAYYVFKDFDFLLEKKNTQTKTTEGHLFVTSSHCIENVDAYHSLWAAGNRTMKLLANLGHWVCASAEGLGHSEIVAFQKSELLKLMMDEKPWYVLSHNESQSEVGQSIACYERVIADKDLIEKKLSKDHRLELMLEAEVIYWSSYKQYEVYTDYFPELKSKIHCSGLGKTFKKLKKKNIPVIPVIDMNHLKQTLKEG